ncbi:MAG TPA: TetR/AcrR family transcriptional regulator [Firmicutes bacterium]|jgi:AcrR family transcriptional regulator|nr:TetR/AcrR family transcriptional regulator [Bacillota bacterium]
MMSDFGSAPAAGAEKSMRNDILEASAQLFKKKGYSGTSMQDIASEVGILKGSIYYYFNSKNEIFREVLDNGVNPVLKNAALIIAEKSTPKEKLRKLIHHHMGYVMDHNYSLVIFFQEREKLPAAQMKKYLEKRDHYENIFREVLREGIEQGDFPDVNVTLTVFAILGMCNWIIQWYNPKGAQNSEDIKEHMEYLIFDRMLNPKMP